MKHERKAGSIQVTAGRESYAVGVFDEDIGTAERLFDSKKIVWKKLHNISLRQRKQISYLKCY